jgi:nucleotide-binding universal stress UspA family protein
MTAIVAGLDGSDGGRRALRFAVAEAALRGCSVEAVRVVRDGDDAALCEHELWADIESVRHEVADAPGVSGQVVPGDPAAVLIERSAKAALLVVGSHGTSSLIHSAMGSVSTACAQLAQCPVVVLPRAVTGR